MAVDDRDDDSVFDVSKFIDLGDSEDDIKLDALDFSLSEIKTKGLSVKTTPLIERYIKDNRIPRNVKKRLNTLTAENDEAEKLVIEVEAKIIPKAKEYHDMVAKLLQERMIAEQVAFDADPYSSERGAIISKDVLENRKTASKLFEALFELENLRNKLNKDRKTILESISELIYPGNNHYEELIELINEKIFTISIVRDITRAKTSTEEMSALEEEMANFNRYIKGEYDPLAGTEEKEETFGEEDEYLLDLGDVPDAGFVYFDDSVEDDFDASEIKLKTNSNTVVVTKTVYVEVEKQAEESVPEGLSESVDDPVYEPGEESALEELSEPVEEFNYEDFGAATELVETGNISEESIDNDSNNELEDNTSFDYDAPVTDLVDDVDADTPFNYDDEKFDEVLAENATTETEEHSKEEASEPARELTLSDTPIFAELQSKFQLENF